MGAASMNVIAAPGARPFEARRRATGTDPHSQTGNAMPAAAAAGSCIARGSLPILAKAVEGTNTSIAAETAAPSRMNGIASTSSEPNTIRRFCSHATRLGCARWTRAASTSSAPSTGEPDTAGGGRPRRLRPRPGDVDGHQQYLANATEKAG